MFAPDNFLYFLILFTISISCGTYLLFAYYANRLLVANALILFLAASRVALEFYLPSIGSFEAADAFMRYQGYGFPVNVLIVLQWICITFYVRPFKGLRWEKIGGNIFLYGVIIIPFFFHSLFMALGKVFYYNPYKIEGYWRFTMNLNHWYYSDVYAIHIKYAMNLIIVVLLIGVVREKKNRLRQVFLLLSFIVFPIVFGKFNVPSAWNIPNTGIVYVVHSLIISWYVSNYRLFKSNINLITKDLFNSISDLTISTNPSFQINNFNEKAKNFFNIGHKKIQTLLEAHITNELCALKIESLLLVKEGQVELEVKDKKGNFRIMNLKLAPFKNGAELYGYTFLFTDLTEIKAKKAQLRQLNNTKDRLFAIIGHDLRKPALEFRGIQNKVNYLINKHDFEMLKKLGMSLEQSALSLNNLLDNLLHWAKQQQGIVSESRELVVAIHVIYEVFEFFEVVTSNKKIELINKVSSKTELWVDVNAITTIIRNLVDNAIKFSFNGSRIIISECFNADSVTITVEDTGVGIDEAKLDTIFEFKEKETTNGTEGEVGSGLGLALVKQLVKANDGFIKVESERNIGTKFHVVFPYQR